MEPAATGAIRDLEKVARLMHHVHGDIRPKSLTTQFAY